LGHIGADKEEEVPPLEYQHYAEPPSENFSLYRPGKMEEFENILRDFSLKADEVGAIRKVGCTAFSL